MRKKLERLILLALHACDGMPMPQSALVSAVSVMSHPESPTRADVLDALKAVEAVGFVSGAADEIADTTWTLTARGIHKARQLQ